MISEIGVTVYQIMRHATEYTLPDRSHTTRNQLFPACMAQLSADSRELLAFFTIQI